MLLRHRELYGLSAVNFIVLVAHDALPNLWVLYLIAQFGWDQRAIGLSLALVGVCSAITASTLVGPAVKRFGERRTLVMRARRLRDRLRDVRHQQRLRVPAGNRRGVPVDLQLADAVADEQTRRPARARANCRARWAPCAASPR